MLITVSVNELVLSRVVWWINTDGTDLLPVLLHQQIQGLPVLAPDQQPIEKIIQVCIFRKPLQQPFFEIAGEMPRINGQLPFFKLRLRRRRTESQGLPFFCLLLVLQDLLMKLLRHTVCRNDVLRPEDEFLLLPQLLLEILNLRQKSDDPFPDLADRLGARDVFVQKPLLLQGFDGNDIGLDEIVQLAGEKFRQILMDEEIPAVLGTEA